jgi:hypothetical protein
MIQDVQLPDSELQQYGTRCLTVGVIGLLISAIGAFTNPEQFFRSYLQAYLFWLGIALGSLAIAMLHHLSGGAWGLVIRRLLESGSRTLPLMGVLFLPILLGLPNLYAWARPAAVAHDRILQHKALYLNVPFFLTRTVVYFAVWILLAHLLSRWSLEQDRTADPSLARRLEVLSGPGLVIYGATMTFASIDWIMSLDAHWFSTIYGLSIMVGQVLGAFSFVIALTIWLSYRRPLSEIISAAHLHDLGKLLLAFVMIWAYMAFSQFLIIYSGNLPEEIPWYLRRERGIWGGIAIGLILFHFVLPFLLLLSRNLKQSAGKLLKVAVLLVFMRYLELVWLIGPSGSSGGGLRLWMDPATLIGIGGVWLAFFLRQLKGKSILPLHDPFLREALEHGKE